MANDDYDDYANLPQVHLRLSDCCLDSNEGLYVPWIQTINGIRVGPAGDGGKDVHALN